MIIWHGAGHEATHRISGDTAQFLGGFSRSHYIDVRIPEMPLLTATPLVAQLELGPAIYLCVRNRFRNSYRLPLNKRFYRQDSGPRLDRRRPTCVTPLVAKRGLF